LVGGGYEFWLEGRVKREMCGIEICGPSSQLRVFSLAQATQHQVN